MKWYEIKAQAANAQAADVVIFDEIGFWGVTAKDFIEELKALVGVTTLRVSINSPGGSVFDALAIFNALRQHPAHVEVTVMGVAASAASLIAMAGNKIIMPENTFMMIHNPMSWAGGNADVLRDMADWLDKIASSLVATYVARTGLPTEEVKALLAAETWLTAQEAVDKGFADEITPALAVSACFDAERLPANVRAGWTKTGPVAVAPAAAPPQSPPAALVPPVSPVDFTLALVAKVGEAGLGACVDAFLLDPLVTNATQLDTALAEAVEINAVCHAGGVPDMAHPLIRARVPLAAVRPKIQQARAALDQLASINHHLHAQPESKTATLSVSGIYQARR